MSIEGIPEGWELVRIGTPLIGEWVVCSDGRTLRWNHVTTNHGYAIVRKIEKPKQYRPFANAVEFEPHRDRWVKYKGDKDCDENNRKCVTAYGDKLAIIYHREDTWKCHFENYVFDDGTPFGVEVTE